MTTNDSNDSNDLSTNNTIESKDELIDKSINFDFFTDDKDKIEANESTRVKILEEIDCFCKSRNLKFIEDSDYWSIKYKLGDNKCVFYCVYSDFDNNRIYLIYEQKIGSSNLRLTYSAIRDKNESGNRCDEEEDTDNFNVIIKFLVNIFQWAIKKIVAFLYQGLKNLLAQFDITLNVESIINYLEDTDTSSESNKCTD